MQKKLIVLALAGLVSGSALAQSNVTIFGIVDVAVESGKYSDAAGNLTRMISGGNNTNRIGFRGTEDLGNGMAANFLLEAQPSPDNGTAAVGTQFWNRNAIVGLSSKSWGSVNLGRQLTPWFNATAANDVFYVAGVGSSYSLFAGDTRMNNSIRWDSVNMNGFTAAVMYGMGQDGDATGVEGTTAATKKLGRDVSLKFSYANGPMSANYGYDSQTISTGPDVDLKRNQLNGAYDFGMVKIGLGWGTNKATGSLDNSVWTMTAVMPVGTDSIKAGYTKLKDKFAGVTNKNSKLFAIGYEHPLSKRTNLYATYAKMDNDAAASKTMLGAVGVAAGYDPTAWQFGMRHSF
ncbi:MAG: porin [Betaproteobacteria bacterium]|nr:porin [Betaproteobacteria bacterium]